MKGNKKMIKTLAQLKRDAKSGKLTAKLVERFGKTDINENMSGWRKIVGANSNSIQLLTNDGRKAWLEIPCANLVEYTDNSLTVYAKGFRDLTADEQAFMNKWKSITDTDEYKKQSEIDMLSDGSTTFYQQKYFFIKGGYEYLLGFSNDKSKHYDYNTGKIKDNKVKGEIELRYEIKMNVG